MDWKPVNETAWRGSPSDPIELAGELAAMESKVLNLPYVEPIEVVTFTVSAANRDLIVAALKASTR